MYASMPPNALALFRAEQRSLRNLLASIRAVDAAGPPSATDDLALQRALPALRLRLRRYCRLKEDFLHVPLSTPEPPREVADSRLGCGIIQQLLERLTALHGQEGKGEEYRAAFIALAEQVQRHFDATQASLFVLARERGLDLAALGEQMLQVPQALPEDAPAAERVPDGRLDIGTADDHTPEPQGESPPGHDGQG